MRALNVCNLSQGDGEVRSGFLALWTIEHSVCGEEETLREKGGELQAPRCKSVYIVHVFASEHTNFAWEGWQTCAKPALSSLLGEA